MGYDFDWAALQRAWPYLLQGLQMTAFLVIAAMAAGIGLGTLLAITRIFAPRPVAGPRLRLREPVSARFR